MAECDANYARLLKLMPDMDTENERTISVAVGEKSVHFNLRIAERCKYTTLLEVSQEQSAVPFAPAPTMMLRVYHDARAAEVISCQGKRHFYPRYQYPNPQMFQEDEKVQLNRFLGEWLAFCLQYGMAIVDQDSNCHFETGKELF